MTSGASGPAELSAQINVWFLPCWRGTLPIARWLLGARAEPRVMAVLKPLSSRKTRRAGSFKKGARSLRNAVRRSSLRSLATSVFFMRDLVAPKHPVNRFETHFQPRRFFEQVSMFLQRGIAMRLKLSQQLLLMLGRHRAVTARGFDDDMQGVLVMPLYVTFHSTDMNRKVLRGCSRGSAL